ncbi:unnamed protein product [Durusdinium trenchii]|uniref:Sulfatase N-terminal domain-containing protein n=1 Tax=Durusdinium trenchii TaxID=1381693 RepID=A0ABP0LAE3_9DINO
MQEKMIDDLTSLTCAFIACILLVTGSPGPAQPLPVVHPRTAKGILQAQCKAYGGIGYPFTGAEGACCNETPVFDWAFPQENGFRCMMPNQLDEEHSPDAWVRRSAQELLDSHQKDHGASPWFLQVNFLGPHPPFILKSSTALPSTSLPEAIDVSGSEQQPVFDLDLHGLQMVPNIFHGYVNITDSRKQYAALLQQIDEELEELLKTVDQMPGETVVAVIGDHGEHLGDHGQFGKTSPFEPAVHVPLIIAGAPFRHNVKEYHPVSTIDVPMTFLELAGILPSPTMQGYSLMPALTGVGTLTRPAVMSGMNYWQDVIPDVNYSHGRVQFDSAAALFGTDFLKLICCPVGCRKGGSLLPTMVAPQVALMNVTQGEDVHRFEKDILNQPAGHGVQEALYLAAFLSKDFQEVCMPLLEALAV